MKTLLLNIPYKDKIVRRFMCSYNSPNFMFPPHELLGVGGIVKEWKLGDVRLLDAVAEGMGLEECITRISDYHPDIIVSLVGIECFESDMNNLVSIKKAFPAAKVVCFGYYPTIFAKEILGKTGIDAILLNEPEISFPLLYDRISSGLYAGDIQGLAYNDNGNISVNSVSERIKDLDKLPYPYHALINQKLYSEPGIGGPFTTIQSSRGCPFLCNYCITTYGHELVYRSPESVIGEIRQIVGLGIRKVRFLDDLFNAKKDRVLEICNMMMDEGLNIEWTSLSRADTLDAEVLNAMKRAGCKRIYVGIESGSQKVLDYYKKGYRAEKIKERVDLIKKAGIEAVGFFIVGSEVEGPRELNESIDLAKRTDFDYIIVTKLTPYPGTPLFETVRDKMDFTLFPYKNEFKDAGWEEEMIEREKKFYRAFYFRFKYAVSKLSEFFRRPVSFMADIFKLASFVLSGNRNKKDHGDYL